MNTQKCTDAYCEGTQMVPTSVLDSDEDCPVCLMPLKGQRLALMPDCDHVICRDCMIRWTESAEVPHCPCCRTRYKEFVSSYGVFRGAPKRALFEEHTNCQFKAPLLRKFFGSIDDEDWRALMRRMMTADDRVAFPYDIDGYLRKNEVYLSYFCSKFVVFLDHDMTRSRVVLYLRLPEMDVQMLLTDERLEFDAPDRDCAAGFVRHLNRQWSDSREALPGALYHDEYIMMRKFGEVHCIFRLEICRDHVSPLADPDAKIERELFEYPCTNANLRSANSGYSRICEMFFYEDYGFSTSSRDLVQASRSGIRMR